MGQGYDLAEDGTGVVLRPQRLAQRRYLVGDSITEADVDTVDFDHIKRHYYVTHTSINPTGIVPRGPDLDEWLRPHGRETLGGEPFGDGTPPPAAVT